MKTRDDIYQKEATELIRVLSDYNTLYLEQIMKLFPAKNNQTITNLLGVLKKQGRLFSDTSNTLVSVDEKGLYDFDLSTLKCFWVLLDFIDDVSYHSTSDYPTKIIFFAKNEVYEVIYIGNGGEHTISRYLNINQSDSKKIIVLEDSNQIESLDIKNILCYCMVTDEGVVNYYTNE